MKGLSTLVFSHAEFSNREQDEPIVTNTRERGGLTSRGSLESWSGGSAKLRLKFEVMCPSHS